MKIGEINVDKNNLVLKIKERMKQALENKERSETVGSFDGTCDYYYWQGYLNALDYVDDLLITLQDEGQ